VQSAYRLTLIFGTEPAAVPGLLLQLTCLRVAVFGEKSTVSAIFLLCTVIIRLSVVDILGKLCLLRAST
jgi:hypothetical protein